MNLNILGRFKLKLTGSNKDKKYIIEIVKNKLKPQKNVFFVVDGKIITKLKKKKLH